jgi:hypothetical protein
MKRLILGLALILTAASGTIVASDPVEAQTSYTYRPVPHYQPWRGSPYSGNVYRAVLPSPLLSKRVQPLSLLDTVLLALIAGGKAQSEPSRGSLHQDFHMGSG